MRRLSFLAGAEQSAVFTQSAVCADVRQKRRIILGGGAALCALLLPAIHRPTLRLVWNVTASVPIGLYRVLPDETPDRGELVAVRPSPTLARYMASRRYVEAGALLVKPVAAVAGQQVCRTGATVTIDDETVATGRAPMPPIMPGRRATSAMQQMACRSRPRPWPMRRGSAVLPHQPLPRFRLRAGRRRGSSSIESARLARPAA